MKKNIKDKNGISYLLVGEIYYPILSGLELPMGIYAQERLNYLSNNFPQAYKHLIENNIHLKRDLFELNCLCEQKFQEQFEIYTHNYPQLNRIERRKAIQKIRNEIFEIYVHQPKGSESDEDK